MAIKNIDIKIPIPNDFFDFSIDKENKDLLLNQIKNLKLTTDKGTNFDFNIPLPGYLNILSPNELYDCYKILYDNITYVTYKDFLDNLLDCFADFTEHLLEKVKILNEFNKGKLPKYQKKIKIYIKKNYTLATKSCKSISAHALIFYLFKLQYKRFPSSKFVQIVDLDEKMEKYKGNLDFNIFLFIDDGIYSGNQITGAIENLKKSTKLTLNISVISPYISEKFHKIIQKRKKQVKFFFKTIMNNYDSFFEKNNTKHQTFINHVLLPSSTPLYCFEFKMPDNLSFLPHLLNNKLFEVISTYYKTKGLYLDEKSLNTITILKPCINYTELEHNISDNSCPFPYYKPKYYNYKKYIKIKEFIETYMLTKLDNILKEIIKKNIEEITIKFSQILTHEEADKLSKELEDKLSKELEELYKLNKEEHIINEAQINRSKVYTFINKYCMEIPENYPQDYIMYIALNLSYIVNENNRGKLNEYLKSQNMQDISKEMIDIVNNIQKIDTYYKNRKAANDKAADKAADQVVDEAIDGATYKTVDKAAEAAAKTDYIKKYMKYKYKYIHLKKKLKN
jgi:hypothetical protein